MSGSTGPLKDRAPRHPGASIRQSLQRRR